MLENIMKLASSCRLLRREKLHFLLTFGWLLNLSQVSMIKFFPELGKFSLFSSEKFPAALHKNIFCTNFDFFSRTLEGFLEQLFFVFGELCDTVVASYIFFLTLNVIFEIFQNSKCLNCKINSLCLKLQISFKFCTYISIYRNSIFTENNLFFS